MGEQVNIRQWMEGRPNEGYRPDSKEMQDVEKHVISGCCQLAVAPGSRGCKQFNGSC